MTDDTLKQALIALRLQLEVINLRIRALQSVQIRRVAPPRSSRRYRPE